MIQLNWTDAALYDLQRLYEFLARVNRSAAAQAIRALVKAPDVLLPNPRIGERLLRFEEREVRWLLIGRSELHYEIQHATINILRLWRTREYR